MKKIFGIFILVILFYIGGIRHANADAPYQISVIHPFQMINQMESIHGIRFNFVYGINRDVYGLDFGMINQVDHYQKGLQIGIVNTSLKTKGVQIGFFNKTDFLEGVQIGLINIHTHGLTKLFPIINWSF